jgi:GNAT superfamily N-acetyltransferase
MGMWRSAGHSTVGPRKSCIHGRNPGTPVRAGFIYTFPMQLTQPAAALDALVDSLRFDPFYAAISTEFDNEGARRAALARYFDYSMGEGHRNGRLVIWPQGFCGAAVWRLPLDEASADAESRAKATFLTDAIGARGAEIYHRLVGYMTPRAEAVVARSAWYLSIVGVAPAAQGQGIGARLLEITLAEADATGVPCYLETFDSRNPRFYQRLGFAAVGTHVEPITRSAYTIMSRLPKARVPP